MKSDDMVIDGIGWVDDFRALPGECGSPLARKIYLQSLIQQGTNIQQLKQMGFSRDMVSEINARLVDEEYSPKIGDLVKVNSSCDAGGLVGKRGIVVGRDRLGALGKEVVRVLVDGRVRLVDERALDVINESR